MTQPDFVLVHAATGAVLIGESASPLDEVLLLEDTTDGVALRSIAAADRLLPNTARMRGLCGHPTDDSAVCVAHVPAPDPALVALMYAARPPEPMPQLKVVRPAWAASRVAIADEEEQEEEAEEDAEGALPTLSALLSGGADSATARPKIETLQSEAVSGVTTTPQALQSTQLQPLLQHMHAMDASLRRAMQSMEQRVQQRLDRLEMMLGLLLSNKSAAGL